MRALEIFSVTESVEVEFVVILLHDRLQLAAAHKVFA